MFFLWKKIFCRRLSTWTTCATFNPFWYPAWMCISFFPFQFSNPLSLFGFICASWWVWFWFWFFYTVRLLLWSIYFIKISTILNLLSRFLLPLSRYAFSLTFFSLNRIWSPHFISRLNRIDSSRIESKFKSAKNRIGFFFMWWQRFNKEQRIGSQKLRRSDRKCKVVNVWKSCISKSTNVLSIFPSYFTDQAMAWHGMASNIFQMARRNGFSIHTHTHFYLCINCNILWFTNQ